MIIKIAPIIGMAMVYQMHACKSAIKYLLMLVVSLFAKLSYISAHAGVLACCPQLKLFRYGNGSNSCAVNVEPGIQEARRSGIIIKIVQNHIVN